MSLLKFYSAGQHFAFDETRSKIESNTFFFRYLHPYSKLLKEKQEFIYIIIEKDEITCKRELITKDQRPTTELSDLLVVPKNTDHHNFLETETQVIRQKIKDESTKHPSFKNFLHHFIEDLYINKYFKECGDTNTIKTALEHIPLLRGIISKHLFDFHYQQTKGIRKLTHWKTNYRRERFEDAYLNYSKFLSNKNHERLFQPGGWFVRNKETSSLFDPDEELFNLEQRFLEIEDNLGTDQFLFTDPVNMKQILKRYGLVDIFRITLGKHVWRLFIFTLVSFIFFILADIFCFNLKFAFDDNSKQHLAIEEFEHICMFGLYISSSIFLLLSVYIGVLLFIKYKMKVVPGIYLPRMLIAIISGWVVFFTAEELLKIDLDMSGMLLFFLTIIVFVVTLFFMVFEVNNYAPAMSWRKVLNRSLVVTGLAFIVSYTFGFWTMTHVNEKFMSIDNFLVNESEFKDKYETNKLMNYSSVRQGLKDFERELNKIESYLIEAFQDLQRDSLLTFEEKDLLQKKLIDFKKNSTIQSVVPYTDTLYVDQMFLDIDDLKAFDTELNQMKEGLNQHLIFIQNTIDSIELHAVTEYNENRDSILFASRTTNILNNINTLKQTQFDFTEIDDQYANLKSTNAYLFEYLAENQDIDVNKKELHAKKYDFFLSGYLHQITFPNMLLTRALLAMFVGIFLQLIIQDKTITEPI